ncbi:DUF309 domain-containing protein [Saccharolobus solfataricus]|uniref:DUF309 domain-containing protein n=3 Tax=Saccharolobus solfataricus TaxID=2287 RepID=Q7LXQ3_SACS2|nr:DUF309 domain-containing protein [Saccharolobus solfataricus]AAK40957.1 Hypothetical protein SSO0652 [Saccharolobus solfataricus P2]AYN75604.1 DUF309 domain-containing protein [Saccharolobus solfataricus]AYN75767.1 DUF309 domain-containing protein [Saccharolobus solfataricus]AYP18601.1 DUF309 domain-containing protein [Saccharolobus solfataricus]AZF68463.1 DUF309 domain-containing protein [Saccharolobus solfataricus]
MLGRVLLFYKKGIFNDDLKKFLRSKNINVIDVRIGKYVEVDIMDDPRKVISLIGEPLFMVTEISGTFKPLFYEMRFWECHEIIEEKWREVKNKDDKKFLQAIILLCASLIKYLKGEIEVSDMLMEKALSLISDLPQELLPLLYISLGLNT